MFVLAAQLGRCFQASAHPEKDSFDTWMIFRSQDDAAAQQVGPVKKAAKAKQDRAAAAADRAAAREAADQEAKRRAELELLLMDEDSLRRPAARQPGERPRCRWSPSRPPSRSPTPAAQNARFVPAIIFW